MVCRVIVSFVRITSRFASRIASSRASPHSSSESLPNAGPALAYISAVNVVGRPRLRASTALYDVRRVHLVPRQIVHALAVDRIRVAVVVVVVVVVASRAGRLPSRASLVVGFVAGWRFKKRQSAAFERARVARAHLLRRRRVGGVDVAGALRRDGDVVVLRCRSRAPCRSSRA